MQPISQVCSFSWSHSPLPSQDLYEAGELKWGTDEAQFIYILGNRSKQHLRLGEFVKTAAPPQVTLRTLFSFPFWLMVHRSHFISKPNAGPVVGYVVAYQVIIRTALALSQDRVLHSTHDTTMLPPSHSIKVPASASC